MGVYPFIKITKNKMQLGAGVLLICLSVNCKAINY